MCNTNKKIYNKKLSKQITFEDILEDGFTSHLSKLREINNIECEPEKTKYDRYSGLSNFSANYIPWWGYADNNHEYCKQDLGDYSLDNTVYDFNKKIFLSGVKNISDLGTNIMNISSDKIANISRTINLNYKNEIEQCIMQKERFMKFVEDLAMSRYAGIGYRGAIESDAASERDNLKIDSIIDDFIEIKVDKSDYEIINISECK